MHDIIIAVISCGVINVIATAYINRRNRLDRVEKELEDVDKRLDEIDERLKTAEKDALRTQLLLMLSDYPDNVSSILTLGEHYFHVLQGNWYLTDLFKAWLKEKDIDTPEWFKEE